MKKMLSLALALILVLASLCSVAVADDKPTISVLAVLDARTTELDQLLNFQRAEEETGVHVEWEFITSTVWAEQKSMILAEGNLPDVVIGSRALTTSDVANNIEYFLPLEDIIPEYAPHIVDMWNEYPATLIANTFPDGHVYTIGHVMPIRPATEAAYYINQDWLDNLGLSNPTTVDELTNVLKEFRDKDANGNGDPNDEIPLIFRGFIGNLISTGTNTKLSADALRGFFQADHCLQYEVTVNEEGKVQYMPVTENFKAWVEYCNMLYSEGLINKDLGTIDGGLYNSLLANAEIPVVGMMSGWTKAGLGKWADRYTEVVIKEGPFGKAYVAANEAYLACSASGGWSVAEISKTCKNPEAALRWLDYFYEDMHGLEAYFGAFGPCLQQNDDGTITIIDCPPETDQNTWVWTNGMGDTGLGYCSKETQAKVIWNAWVGEKAAADAKYADNVRDESYIYPPVTFDRDTNTTIEEIETDMKTFIREKVAHWISDGGVEEEWGDYLDQLNKMGLERYLDIYQTKLNEIRK